MCRAITASNVQALSPDFLLIRKGLLGQWYKEEGKNLLETVRKNVPDAFAVSLGLFLQKAGFRMVVEPHVMVRTDRKEPLMGFSEGFTGKARSEIPEDPCYNPNFSETRPFLV